MSRSSSSTFVAIMFWGNGDEPEVLSWIPVGAAMVLLWEGSSSEGLLAERFDELLLLAPPVEGRLSAECSDEPSLLLLLLSAEGRRLLAAVGSWVGWLPVL